MHGNLVRHVLKRFCDRVARQDRKCLFTALCNVRSTMCQTSCASQHATHNCTDWGNPSWRLFPGRLLGFITRDASLSQLLTQVLRPAGGGGGVLIVDHIASAVSRINAECARPRCLKNAVHL